MPLNEMREANYFLQIYFRLKLWALNLEFGAWSFVYQKVCLGNFSYLLNLRKWFY